MMNDHGGGWRNAMALYKAYMGKSRLSLSLIAQLKRYYPLFQRSPQVERFKLPCACPL
jgi:hypothetical protein